MRTKFLAAAALALLMASTFISTIPASASTGLTNFNEINAAWGTPSNSISAAPGDKDIPLTVTLQYDFATTASSVVGSLILPTGFSLYDGTSETFSTTSGSVAGGSVFEMTFQGIFLSPSLAVGLYNFSLDLSAYSGTSLLFEQDSVLAVYVEGTPQLQFSTSTPSLTAGQVDDVPLTLSNVGSGNASRISLTISGTGASVLTPSLKVPSLGANESSTVEVEVYVPSSAAGSTISFMVAATYYDPYGVQQSASQTIGLYAPAASTPVLSFQAMNVSLVPGSNNTVPVTLTNLGTGPALQVRTQVSAPSQTSILTQFPLVSNLGPNASFTASIVVYVSGSLTGSPIDLSFSSTYTNEFGNAGSYTQSVGLYTRNATSSLPSVLVSVSPVESEVNVGVQSEVSFEVEDVGPPSLLSPVLSLAVSSPLVVIRNSSYAVPGGVLEPGDSIVYDALVGSGTSASPGFYTASVTVTYIDQSGATKSATVSTALVLTGTIDLVVQSPEVTQGNTTLSVSGEILNEGFSSAYYATVTGSIVGVKGTSQADYVGEIDPNTPVPFSLTLNYIPENSVRTANISIDVAFKDSLGNQRAYSAPVQTTLSPSSFPQSSTSTSSGSASGADLLTYLEIGVVAAFVVMGAVGFFYIRRNRASTSPAEPQEKADKGVI